MRYIPMSQYSFEEICEQCQSAINQVRTFADQMSNPVRRKIFFLYHFAPDRYTQFTDLMYTLNTDYHQGLITKEQFDNTLLSF